jgi:hypothetical protein
MRSTRWPRGAVRGASSTLRWAGGCLATAAALTLTGCVPTPAEPAVTPSASASSSAPVFASDEKALAAATKAYSDYQRAVDMALSTHDVHELPEYANGQALETARSSVAEFMAAGHRQVGESSATSLSFASLGGLRGDGSRDDPAQIYACLDFSDVDVLDAEGHSVTSPDRQRSYSMTADLQLRADSLTLIVTREEVWSSDDVCD